MGNEVIGGGVRPFVLSDLYTSGNMDIYVDGSIGSDITGNGTSGNPYATPTRADQDIAENIGHRVRVFIASGAYTDFPSLDRHRFFNEGSLAFIAVGAYTEVLAETTLTGKADLGAGGHTFTVAAAGWTPEAFAGSFLLATSGAASGRAIPILNNTADTLWCPKRTTVPANGDNIKIIRPTTTITIPRLTVRAGGEYIWDSASHNSRIAFYNLELNISGAANNTLALKEGFINLQFVLVRCNDSAFDPIALNGATINGTSLLDTGASGLTGTGISNLRTSYGNSPGFTARRVTPGKSANGVLAVGYPRGVHGNISQFTSLDHVSGLGDIFAYHCGFRRTPVIHAEGFFSDCLCDAAGAATGFWGFTDSKFWLQNCYILGCTNASIQVAESATISNCAHDPATPYGATIGPNGLVKIDQSSKTGLAGATADILFTAPSPDTTGAFPVEGAQTTDSRGASVVGLA